MKWHTMTVEEIKAALAEFAELEKEFLRLWPERRKNARRLKAIEGRMNELGYALRRNGCLM